MPQLDIFTFFGQVTWFVVAFMTYFIAIGTVVLPAINRSIKLRAKKLAYQLSFGKESLGASSYDSSLIRATKEIQNSLLATGQAQKQIVIARSSLLSPQRVKSL